MGVGVVGSERGVKGVGVGGRGAVGQEGVKACDELINRNIVSMLIPACIDCNRGAGPRGVTEGRGRLFFSAQWCPGFRLQPG